MIKRTVIFNGKPYLDLVVNGKQVLVDKLVFITKHRTLTADNIDLAGRVSVFAIPNNDESKNDNILIDSIPFNLPSVAGEYTATIIQSDKLSKEYAGIIVEITYASSSGVAYLEEVLTETVVFKDSKSLIDNSHEAIASPPSGGLNEL